MTPDEVRAHLRHAFARAGFQGERLERMVEVGMEELYPEHDEPQAGPLRCPNCEDWLDVRVLDGVTVMLCETCHYRETRL